MDEENSLIVSGPPFLSPLPAVSVGQYIYKHLIENDKEYDALVDAKTGIGLSFYDVLKTTCRLATCLKNYGLKKNDVILICSENNLYFMQPVVAAMYLGVCVATANQNYTKDELLHCLSISKPKVIFCSKSCYPKFLEIRPLVPSIEKIIVFSLDKNKSDAEDYQNFLDKYTNQYFNPYNFTPEDLDAENHIAAILSSSGTTGLPKGVMITHKNIIAKMHHNIDPRFSMVSPNATHIAFLPLFHAYGFVTALQHLTFGNRLVVLEKFSEDLFLSTIEKYRISHLWVVPPIIILLAKSPKVSRYDLRCVQHIACGAAPLSKDIEAIVVKKFNIQRFVQGYGLTEATLSITVTPIEGGKVGSCGKVLPGILIKIKDPESGKILGPNQTGEIIIKGPAVSKGYYGNEEATKCTFKDGWLYSGDLGYYDEDGFFFIVDRLKELIKYKGFQVAPAELEALLLKNPKIKEAGVTGKKHDLDGEHPVAFVVKQDGASLTEAEVELYVASRVNKNKHLYGGVIFVKEIPKNASGKILRRELRKMLESPKHKL